jgi:DNA-binding winged helix-turn-helix (wHTH) protein
VNRIYFDPFTLDLDRRLLLRGEEEIHLTPKMFQLLHALADNAPKAMSKDELFDLVWEGTIVAEVNLASTINDIRVALKDDARHPKYIRTVHAYGYAFIAPVRTETDEPPRRTSRFHLLVAGNDIALSPGEHLLGRDQDSTVVVPDTAVSRRHARILVRDDSALLEDLGSKNGTFLNGVRLAEPATLRPGDAITVGSITAVFRDLGSPEPTRTLGR